MIRAFVINDSLHGGFVIGTTLSVIFEKERMHNQKIKVILTTFFFFKRNFKSLPTKLVLLNKLLFCVILSYSPFPLKTA